MMFGGIDPGAKGGIAILDTDGDVCTYKYFVDFENWKAVNFFLKGIKAAQEPLFFCLELVWGVPVWGSKMSFNFGGNFYNWKLLLELNDIPCIEKAPATWQPKILNISRKKSAETKKISVNYINKRFPQLNLPSKTLKDIDKSSGISDAVCLALFGRYTHSNTL